MSYVTELNVAAGTLETARVPESIHGMQQESINDLATTPCATPHSIVVVVVVVIVAVVIVVVVVRRRCRSVLFGAVHIVSFVYNLAPILSMRHVCRWRAHRRGISEGWFCVCTGAQCLLLKLDIIIYSRRSSLLVQSASSDLRGRQLFCNYVAFLLKILLEILRS